jgi:mediator of RNA polymerase II transcription subunit 25
MDPNDIIFLIEGTAVNGAYMNEMKTNYILPILEHFSKGVLDDRESYTSDKYGAVVFKTAQAMPNVCCSSYGPFNTSQKLHSVIDNLELTDGKSESNANLAEGMVSRLDKTTKRTQHCYLTCRNGHYRHQR